MVEADYTGVVLDGRYRVEARLGQGGMGTVYVAEHVGLGQPRAIKFLRDDLARKPGAVQRFLQEARVLSAMRHDHLVGVIDMGEHAGSAYYVMELLAGEDLRRRLRRLGGLGWPQARAIALQVCAALRLTHARGVVHRDLKPENCFCVDAPDGGAHVKLIDFGVAKVPREAGGASQLTGAGELLGTIGYMAPEQLEGQGDRRADIYSLGAMLFEMLAGRPLHTGNAYEILARMLLAPAPALASVIAVDPAIDRLIATAVARDPADRFATMDAFAAAIAEIPATAEPQAFTRPAAAPARLPGETTAGGAPVPTDMPVTGTPGPEDMPSLHTNHPARAPADGAPTPSATRSPDTLAPVPADRLTRRPEGTSSAAPTAAAAVAAPGESSVRVADPAAAAVPADSSPARSRSRAATLSAVGLLAAVLAWQAWPAASPATPARELAAAGTPGPSSSRDDAPASGPAGGPSAAAVPADSPATPRPGPADGPSAAAVPADNSATAGPAPAGGPAPGGPAPAGGPAPGGPVPADSPGASRPPVPADSPETTAGPDPADSPETTAVARTPVPATSPARTPGKPARDVAKPAPTRPLTREALRDRLARELAACGSPYVAEEIAVRVTPGGAGEPAGLAVVADAGLASGTVDCLERELARVHAGLAGGVDGARAFDVSLTLPRRGGG